MPKKPNDKYSDEEAARRRDELAKRMLNMPPHPLKPKPKDGTKENPPKKHGRPKSMAIGVVATMRSKK
jgi:hypothetical protein